MIITLSADGSLFTTVPENINQGSNNANTIAVVSTTARTNNLMIAFKLPQTNVYTKPALMTLADNIDEQTGFNVWTYTLDAVITQNYGECGFQIQVVTPTETLASNYGRFLIQKGVPTELPAEPTQTIYEQILANISAINADLYNLQEQVKNSAFNSKDLLPYDSTFNYPLGGAIFDNTTQAIYMSLQANNLGNALTNTDYWAKYKLGDSIAWSKYDSTKKYANGDVVQLYAETDVAGRYYLSLKDENESPLTDTTAWQEFKQPLSTALTLSGASAGEITLVPIFMPTQTYDNCVAQSWENDSNMLSPNASGAQRKMSKGFYIYDDKKNIIHYCISQSYNNYQQLGFSSETRYNPNHTGDEDYADIEVTGSITSRQSLKESYTGKTTIGGISIRQTFKENGITTTKFASAGFDWSGEPFFRSPSLASTTYLKDLVINDIIIEAPASATNGTLTEEQFTLLTANTRNRIILNNEIYNLNDPQVDAGYYVYSHLGEDSTHNFFAKCITVTISTRGWVLTSADLRLRSTTCKFSELYAKLNELHTAGHEILSFYGKGFIVEQVTDINGFVSFDTEAQTITYGNQSITQLFTENTMIFRLQSIFIQDSLKVFNFRCSAYAGGKDHKLYVTENQTSVETTALNMNTKTNAYFSWSTDYIPTKQDNVDCEIFYYN